MLCKLNVYKIVLPFNSCIRYYQCLLPMVSILSKPVLLGCFWGLQLAFQRVPGVLETEVGYTQGQTKNPTYEEVCEGKTGHAEAVQVTYDPSIISYEELLDFFWDFIDPTALNEQGNDVGTQYRSGIFYHSDLQKTVAFRSRDALQQSDLYSNPVQRKIVTQITGAKTWYRAEESHQRYLEKGGQCASKGDISAIRCYGELSSALGVKKRRICYLGYSWIKLHRISSVQLIVWV